MKSHHAIWKKKESKILDSLTTPGRIQGYLDGITYDPKTDTRSPRWVLKEQSAHCFEGALFAAACLRNIGHRPLLVDLRAVNDDDHVIAVYQVKGLWGAIAKSNFTTIRFREPVFRSIRELALSYFDFYFNTLGQKTLREYSLPLDLSRFDRDEWMTTDNDLEYIGEHLDRVRHYALVTKHQVERLEKVSPSILQAGLLGSDPEGLFKPKI